MDTPNWSVQSNHLCLGVRLGWKVGVLSFGHPWPIIFFVCVLMWFNLIHKRVMMMVMKMKMMMMMTTMTMAMAMMMMMMSSLERLRTQKMLQVSLLASRDSKRETPPPHEAFVLS